MITAEDRRWLRACGLWMSVHARFRVEPNPLVGCVIWRRRSARRFDAWEGQHLAYGGPHAEVNALSAAGQARGATVYVSLEPCTTTGKTGPCVEALAKAGVKRVVWAVADPNPAHRGKAAKALRAHGIIAEGPAYRTDPFPDLTIGLRRSLVSDRPWVLAKWAQTLDGKLAFERGRPASISGESSWREVHELRGRVEAVAVGVGTVLADDPRLDCRLPGGPPDGRPQPAAVVFDSRLRTPIGSKLVRRASLARPLHLYVASAPARRLREFARKPGVVVTQMRGRGGRVDLARALVHLKAQGCRRLLVEGGGALTGALLVAGLVDQVAAIVAPFVLGDPKAPSLELPAGARARVSLPRLEHAQGRRVGDDVWIEGYVRPVSAAGRRRVSARSRARS